MKVQPVKAISNFWVRDSLVERCEATEGSFRLTRTKTRESASRVVEHSVWMEERIRGASW